jgi:pyruvate/2-oxoglutarate dehydrogenase complex dihydrolipoamide acyltransferase (E2) component
MQRCAKSIATESSDYSKMRIISMAKIEVPMLASTRLSVGRWFKRLGDPVTVQEPLVEIDTDSDGVTHEIRAPITGVLSKILVEDGGTLEPGTVLGMIDQVGSDATNSAFTALVLIDMARGSGRKGPATLQCRAEAMSGSRQLTVVQSLPVSPNSRHIAALR